MLRLAIITSSVAFIGDKVFDVIERVPARLREVARIGLVGANHIAMQLGIDKTAAIRVRAGISYALSEAMDEGPCGLPTG